MARSRHYFREGRKWSFNEMNQLRDEVRRGLSDRQIAEIHKRPEDAIMYRKAMIGMPTHAPIIRGPTQHIPKVERGKFTLPVVAILVLIALALIYLGNGTSQLGSIFSANNTPYLTQNQLYDIYGIGSYGSIPATITSESVSGQNLYSIISSGSELTANFSTPAITFSINTSISNITIDKSYIVAFNIKKNGKYQVIAKEFALSSPQANYLFEAQSQIATNDGYVNGMQYFVVNGTEFIGNKGNWILIFKCSGALCTNQTVNQTIIAVSKDAI